MKHGSKRKQPHAQWWVSDKIVRPGGESKGSKVVLSRCPPRSKFKPQMIFSWLGFYEIDWTLPSWTTMFTGMDADEQDICNYLKQWHKQFISGREICRRAGGKRRFRDDPYWANQPL